FENDVSWVPMVKLQIWPAKRPTIVDLRSEMWILVVLVLLIIDQIDKIEKLIIDRKVTLVDDEGKPSENVDYSGDYDSEEEVASVDNEMAIFLAENDGYGTQSLLEQ
nr:hypothetical protein [Tanacetum cinerariifolium]